MQGDDLRELLDNLEGGTGGKQPGDDDEDVLADTNNNDVAWAQHHRF